MDKESSWMHLGNHLGDIWEASGRHLGGIWRGIWGGLAGRGLQEAPGGQISEK